MSSSGSYSVLMGSRAAWGCCWQLMFCLLAMAAATTNCLLNLYSAVFTWPCSCYGYGSHGAIHVVVLLSHIRASLITDEKLINNTCRWWSSLDRSVTLVIVWCGLWASQQHRSVINSIDEALVYGLLLIFGLEVGINVAFGLVRCWCNVCCCCRPCHVQNHTYYINM